MLLACALGCGSATAPQSSSTTGGGDSTGTTGSTGGTTYDGATPCTASEVCEGGFCVAPYDGGAPTVAMGMGDAVCVATCVPELALDRWCIDDAACCAGLSCGTIDGLCVGPGGSSDTTVGDSWVTVGDDSSSGTGATSSTEGSSTEGTSTTATSTDGSSG